MALNDITFIKGQGGLGRALAGEDYISGMVFYTNTLPSGFTSANPVKQVFSVAGAEALGIKNDYSDETRATGSVEFTAVGTDGDVVTITVGEEQPDGSTKTVTLCTYTKLTADNTPTLLGDAVEAAINAGTSTHGYAASNDTGVVTITARKGMGILLNTNNNLTSTPTGTMTTTDTQFSGGVASKLAVYHYHISEYFRIQPKGNLYVGFFPVPVGSYDFKQIATMQATAQGKIRQIAVYKDSAAFAVGDMTTIQNRLNELEAKHMPLASALYAADISAVTQLSTLTDLNTLTASNVSAVISQDGGNKGATLFLTTGKSITNMGAALGTISLAKVSDSIAWIQEYNISDGQECDTVAFANGEMYNDTDDNLVAQLNTYRYIFLTKRVGIAGSYWNDSHTAVAASSDYAYIENNRVINKAIRGVYASLLPSLNSPLTLNNDGTLAETTISALETSARPNLDAMVRESELSGYSVTIDPAQNVQSTSKLEIAISLLGIGVARNIEVNIGYVISL